MATTSLGNSLKAELAKDNGVKPVTPNQPVKDQRSAALQDAFSESTKDLTAEKLEFRKGEAQNVNFTQYDKKLEKLQSYGSKYQKYGYNPYINNEKFYDDMTTSGEQWVRSLKGAGKLASIGFTDNALFGTFAGIDSHKEYAKTVDLYTSTKGGKTGFFQNLVLNGGYTVGIIADMALEEAVMAGITVLTLGGASEATIPGMAAKGVQSFKNIKNAYNMYSDLSKAVRTANKLDNANPLLKMGNLLNPFENTTNFVKSLKNVDQLKDASNLTKTMHGAGALFRDAKAIHLAKTEADLEGNMLHDEMYDNFIKNHKGPLSPEDAARYKKLAEQASYAAKYENMVVIGATNKLVFDNMYKAFDDLKGIGRVISENRFYDLAKRSGMDSQVVRKGWMGAGQRTKMMFADGFGKGLYRTAKTGVSKAGTYFAGNISEGIQENLQEAINAKNKHMYGSAEHGDYFESVIHGLKSQLNGQGLETFMSGFLMGGVVSPISMTVQKVANMDRATSFQFLTNRTARAEAMKTEKERLEADARLINETFQNAGDVFNSKGMALAEQAELETQMVEAAGEGDQNKFQNVKDKSYRLHLHTMMKHGMMEEFRTHLEDMKSMDAKQFKEAFPTVDVNMTKAQRDAMIDNKIAKSIAFENHYNWAQKNLKSPVNMNTLDPADPNYNFMKNYHDYYERAKDEFIFNKAEFEDNLNRKKTMFDQLRNEHEAENISFNDYQKLFSEESLVGEIKMLESEVAALDYNDNDAKGKQLVKEKKAKLEALERFHESLTEMNEVSDRISELENMDEDEMTKQDKKELKLLNKQYDQASTRVFNRHNQYLKQLAPKKSGVSFENFSEKSFKILHDYYKLDSKNRKIDEAINVLTNPKRMDEIIKRQVEKHEVFMTQFKRYVKNSLAMSRNKEQVQGMLHELYAKGIGFPLNYLDELTEKGILPPVLYDLETGKVLSSKVTEKNRKGVIKKVEKNPKFIEGLQIIEKTYKSLHGTPSPTPKEATEEEVSKAINEQADEAIQAAEDAGANLSEKEKSNLKKEYIPTEEDDVPVSKSQPIENYPVSLLNTLIDEYKTQVENEDFMDPEVDTLTPENLTRRFKQWATDNAERYVGEHNERVSDIPSTYDSITDQQKRALMELGYDSEEAVNALTVKDVNRIISGETKVEKETKTKLDELADQVEIVKEDEEDTTSIEEEVETTTDRETEKENTEEEGGIKLSENATDEEIEAAAEELLSKAEEDGSAEQLINEFEEEVPEVTNEELEEDDKYGEFSAKEAIRIAESMFTPIEGESDYYNAVMAVEKHIVQNFGNEIGDMTIDEDLLRAVYSELRKIPGVSQELVYESSKRADQVIYESRNQEILEAKNKTKGQREKELRKLGYTKKDIDSFSEETKSELIGEQTTKKQYLESLKQTEVEQVKEIEKLFSELDTNVRTESELDSILSKIALENQELFDKYEEAVFYQTNGLKMKLAMLKEFKFLKPGDVVRMNDGSLKKVDKLTKSKVILVNYNDIVRNAVEFTKAEFNEAKPLIINDFSKKQFGTLMGIKSELEKQNVDDLFDLFRTFTASNIFATSPNEEVSKEDLLEHFKLCK